MGLVGDFRIATLDGREQILADVGVSSPYQVSKYQLGADALDRAGFAPCGGDGSHQLTISSASGSNVTVPGEDTFPYQAGTVVPVVATPDDGHQFH